MMRFQGDRVPLACPFVLSLCPETDRQDQMQAVAAIRRHDHAGIGAGNKAHHDAATVKRLERIGKILHVERNGQVIALNFRRQFFIDIADLRIGGDHDVAIADIELNEIILALARDERGALDALGQVLAVQFRLGAPVAGRDLAIIDEFAFLKESSLF